MTSKAAFAEEEWELLADSPFWVHVSLTSHRAGGGQLVGKEYVRTLDEALPAAKGSGQLVKEVVAANKDREFTRAATFNTAKQKLEEIGTLLEQKVDDQQEADEFRAFLLSVGQKVAESTSEGLFGLGDKVSSKEVELLDMIKVALKATEADEQRRAEAARREQAEAKAKTEAERKRKEAEAEAKAEAERKRKEAETEAKAKAERKRKEAETEAKAKAEAERKRKEAETEAKAKAEAERKRKEAEAASKAKAQEAAAKPAPTPAQPARVKEPAAPAEQTYVVKAGDSLSKIAQAVYGDLNRWREIYEANKDKIPNPDVIEVGQELVLPAGASKPDARIYEVKAGDSLSKIAQEMYGQASRWEEIFQANKDQIKDPAMIHPGQKLRIP